LTAGSAGGSSGENTTALVTELQAGLTTLGYYGGPIDGLYGSDTTDAVAALQEDLGVPIDGRYGPQTHEAAMKALGETQSEAIKAGQTELKDLATTTVQSMALWARNNPGDQRTCRRIAESPRTAYMAPTRISAWLTWVETLRPNLAFQPKKSRTGRGLRPRPVPDSETSAVSRAGLCHYTRERMAAATLADRRARELCIMLVMSGRRRCFWIVVLGLVLMVGCSPDRPSSTSDSIDPLLPISTVTTTRHSSSMQVGDAVPGQRLWALVDGNDLLADRINLVFAPWGWAGDREFLELVRGSLSWEGDAYIFDDAGHVTDDPTVAVGAGLGLFAIEPWRSSIGLFNIWYTDVEPDTPVSWLNAEDQPFALDDAVVVTVAVDAHRFNPDLTSVAGFDGVFVGPGIPHRPASDMPFAHAVVVVESAFPVGGLVAIPHELGHGMFNLPDEYVGQQFGFDGRDDLSSWPSCAEGPVEGDAWWGDLVGRVDPMLTLWLNEMAAVGFPINGDAGFWEKQIEVGNVDGGCYAVSGSVRATIDSLMNSSIPVLGSVNRRWAYEVLQLWEGTSRP
jgi:hypothetical protein